MTEETTEKPAPAKSAHLVVSVRGWRRKGNFYHAIGPEIIGQSPPSEARMRQGKDTVILAPGNRVKLWLEMDCDGEALGWRDPKDVICDGIVKGNGDLHTAHVSSATWMRLLRNVRRKPSGAADTEAAIEPIDACIEGTFDKDNTARNGYWIGRFDDLPPWLGDDVQVSIAPPDQDDGAYLIAPEVVPEDMPPWLRVNGVWMLTSPIYYRRGHWLLGADPMDVVAARHYDGTVLPNDDTLPIRARGQIRPLFMKIVPNFGYTRPTKEQGDDYIAWREAATTIEYAMMGLGQAHRQARYYRIRERESADSANSKMRLARNRYARRAKAYADYDFERWLGETKDKYATKWDYEAGRASESAKTCARRAEHIETGIAAKRAEVGVAEETAARLEAKYEDFIRTMYLTPG